MNLPLLLCLWIVQGSIASFYAKRRGRNPYVWFAIGCFFGLLGIIAVFFLKNPQKKSKHAKAQVIEPHQKTLPHRMWYYLDQNSQQYGPISTAVLEEALKEGKISATTYVWHEGMEAWKYWQEIREENGLRAEIPLALPNL